MGVKIVSIHDTSTSVRSPPADFDRPSVDRFLAKVSAIANALIDAIESVPPPTAMRDALPASAGVRRGDGAGASRRAEDGDPRRETSDGASFDILTLFGRDGADHRDAAPS